MKHIKEFDNFLNESAGYDDLKDFFHDLLEKFDLKAEDTSAILLDVTGGFGFIKETVVVDIVKLAEETASSEGDITSKVNKVFSDHKDKINKRPIRSGFAFTYK
jgi:hypothetical protein